ncbi:hypothetical protein ACS0TY_028756 [Phlomoides rotata]
MRNPSDHYLRTINQDFDNLDVEQAGYGGKRSAVEAINILVRAYESSDTVREVKQCVDEICQQKYMGSMKKKKGSQSGFITQCVVLTQRSFKNMFRDLGYYWFRFAIYIALCICVGTIFHDIGYTKNSIQARGSMLAFVSSFMTFMAVGGFPSFVEDMKIFSRERLNGHYGVAAFVVGNTLSSVPFLLLVSIPPGALAYYLVGLQKSADHFTYFSLLLFSSMMQVESLMMVVAAVVPDFLMGIITGAGIQGIMILNNGFFRLPSDIPNLFWKYPVYHISLHKYANQGLYKKAKTCNEFMGLTFPDGQNSTIKGDEILRSVWQMEIGKSKWIDLWVIIGMVVGYRVLFWFIIKGAEKVKPMIRALLAPSTKQRTNVEDPHNFS